MKKKIIQLTRERYDFISLKWQMITLNKCYPFLQIYTIGKSVNQLPLYALRLGCGPRKIHINASHHGNEWITTFILMRCIEILCSALKNGESLYGMEVKTLLQRVTYDFVPMVNPDGVMLALEGKKSQYFTEAHLKWNEGNPDFTRWKANARGVDLNRNYDAGFLAYQHITKVHTPYFAYYQGPFPESEPESKALADLTRRQQYDLVLAYHTQGEVIYWTYDNEYVATAKEYAKMFEEVSGYILEEPDPLAASGGYKDWFIKTFKKPGFTIECGLGENPISISQSDEIIERTLPILLLAAKDIRKEDH